MSSGSAVDPVGGGSRDFCIRSRARFDSETSTAGDCRDGIVGSGLAPGSLPDL
jgi:hypothetical protein